MAVFYFAVKPDVDPQKDRQGDGGDQAGRKQALPARKAAEGGDQRQEIQAGQKDDADQRRDLFGGFLFFHEGAPFRLARGNRLAPQNGRKRFPLLLSLL